MWIVCRDCVRAWDPDMDPPKCACRNTADADWFLCDDRLHWSDEDYDAYPPDKDLPYRVIDIEFTYEALTKIVPNMNAFAEAMKKMSTTMQVFGHQLAASYDYMMQDLAKKVLRAQTQRTADIFPTIKVSNHQNVSFHKDG